MKLEFEQNTPTIAYVENDYLNKNGSDKNLTEAAKMLEAGVKLAQEGRNAEARNLLLRATEADPENESAWLWLASISEYPEELLVFLNSVLKINPRNERALEWAKATKSLLSKTFVQRGIDASKNFQKDFAKQCFLQAVVHDNQNEMAWLWLASVSDSDEEKMMYFQKVLEINPHDETAVSSLDSLKNRRNETILQKAVGLAVADDYESALETLQGMSDAAEEGWVLRSYLARSFDEKLNCYERVLELNPENEMAQASLLSLLSLMEKAESNEEASVAEEVFEAREFSNGGATELTDASGEEIYDLGEVAADEDSFALAEDQTDAELAADESTTQRLKFPFYYSQPKKDFEESEVFEEPEAAFYSPEPKEVELDSKEMNEVSFVSEQQNEVEFAEDENEIFAAVDFQAKEDSVQSQFYSPDETFSSSNGFAKEMQAENGNAHFDEESYFGYAKVNEDWNSNEDSSNVYESETDVFSAAESNDAPQPVAAQNGFYEEDHSYHEENRSRPIEELSGEQNEAVYAAGNDDDLRNQFQEVSHKLQVDVKCPFCGVENEAQAFVCNSCRAALSLSDLEMILAHQESDKEMIGNAVRWMENQRSEREFTADDLKLLGIGYLNLKDLRKGLNCLKQAVRINPDDIVLSSQVNALAIRLADIERQESIHSSMPRNRTILVVDDSATVRKLVSGKLEKSGHEVICAVDGIDALEKLQTAVPDLILLDINMPRMDGYQVCKMIRTNQATKDVPVVMISGKDGFFDKVRGRMAGTTGYITKPFGPETLMKTVESYVAHSEQ